MTRSFLSNITRLEGVEALVGGGPQPRLLRYPRPLSLLEAQPRLELRCARRGLGTRLGSRPAEEATRSQQ